MRPFSLGLHLMLTRTGGCRFATAGRAGRRRPTPHPLPDYGAPKFKDVHNPRRSRDAGFAESGARPDPKKRRLRTGAFSNLAQRLQIEVHEKLVRMRAQTQRIVLLHFHLDPVIKEILVEHVAFEEEVVISLQRLESA